MKAAIYTGKRSIEIREVDAPAPKPGYVLLEMEGCGICGSDLHQYLGRWDQPANAGGHEVAGVVAACGAGVTNVQVGDRVTAECIYHCGTCRFCRVGDYNLCDSMAVTGGGDHQGFAEYIIAHAASLVPLPEEMSAEDGVMVEPLAVAYRVFRRSGASYQDTVLVVGAGTIGLLVVAVARACGVRRVLAVARYAHQADMARELGADMLIRPSEQNVVEHVLGATQGLGADVAIEATASAAGFDAALAAVRKRGSVVLTGSYTQALQVDLQPIVVKELSVTSSMCYGYSGLRKDFEWAIELISSGKVPASKLITHRFPLDDTHKAFEVAADKGKRSIKVLVYNAAP